MNEKTQESETLPPWGKWIEFQVMEDIINEPDLNLDTEDDDGIPNVSAFDLWHPHIERVSLF